MRLLIDMNLSPGWARFLSGEGHDAEHWSQLGPANADDAELMRFAVRHAYVIPTADLDFGGMLAASGGLGPSVVQIRADDLSPTAIGSAVVAALRQAAGELATGALVTVDPRRARMTLLPIGIAASEVP